MNINEHTVHHNLKESPDNKQLATNVHIHRPFTSTDVDSRAKDVLHTAERYACNPTTSQWDEVSSLHRESSTYALQYQSKKHNSKNIRKDIPLCMTVVPVN